MERVGAIVQEGSPDGRTSDQDGMTYHRVYTVNVDDDIDRASSKNGRADDRISFTTHEDKNRLDLVRPVEINMARQSISPPSSEEMDYLCSSGKKKGLPELISPSPINNKYDHLAA